MNGRPMKRVTLTRHLDAEPDDAFGVITDVRRLPAWNQAITRVLDVPPAMDARCEWVVELSVWGRRWSSRSCLEQLEPRTRRFAYRSASDDGNPSYADWTWTVAGAAGPGCEVTVSWELHPATFWRRTLLARLRQRRMERVEARASLAALDDLLCRAAGRA